MEKINPKYANIINDARPISSRPKMSLNERAAQFSPFAALNGHQAAIDETERYVEKMHELSNDEKLILNEKLRIVKENCINQASHCFTYFEPDPYKNGGRYLSKQGIVKKIDEYNDDVVFLDNSRLKIGYLKDITSDIIDQYL